MYVIKRKDKEEYLSINSNTYKLSTINKCSVCLSEEGANESLTKSKSLFYLAHTLKLKPSDFEVREVQLVLKTK